MPRPPIAAALLLSLAVAGGRPPDVQAAAAAGECRERNDVDLWWSPEAPVAGQPLRILAVSDKVRAGEVAVTAGGKKVAVTATVRRGGPPFSFGAEVAAPAAGPHRLELRADGKVLSCRTVTVGARAGGGKARGSRAATASVWEATRTWNRSTENLYAAWIEALFDAPPEESLSFPALAPAIHDPRRNFLHGHLALREDDPRNVKNIPKAEPDCADLPYWLRSYFAWKMSLPFSFRDCDRGTANRPPRCGPALDNNQPAEAKEPLLAFRKFMRQLANKVHSGSGRTALTDDQTDYYPVKLTREALRPGTIYADPYGHVLMIVKWVDQGADAGGRLLAVDGQPDNSVGRKRFWEGTFLFASDVKSAGPGFKVFRPTAAPADAAPGGTATAAPLGNDALARDARFAPFSAEQGEMSGEAFYARMAKLINPRGLEASAAYEETLNALVEQLETRIGSVDNGEKYMRENNNPQVPMPEGPKIFETVGPWEDYATPSRDMRLIIATNVLLGLPARVERHPELFVLGGKKPAEVRAELQRLHERRIRERAIEYKRSDGTPFKLTVADVIARKSAFEIAYNPNDCVEVRWGASENTPDFATCRRRAPDDQRTRMTQYRPWFRDARRPSR
jgi:hypothetical protein